MNQKFLKKEIKIKEEQINKLNQTKSDIEKGLVDVEANKITKKYSSEEIYQSLKQELTKRYNKIKVEIEDAKNSLQEIGNGKRWLDWIDTFGSFIKSQRNASDTIKKNLLKGVIGSIKVGFDNIEKVHILTINFKIPVFQRVSEIYSNFLMKKPVVSLVSSGDQNDAVENYSTVTQSSPTAPFNDSPLKGYSLRLSVELKSANLWQAPYSEYQQELFDIITRFHNDGKNFKEIADWLNANDYKTPRGCTFKQNHVWSIYQKKNRSIKRFSREFDDVITDVGIDIVDIIPTKEDL